MFRSHLTRAKKNSIRKAVGRVGLIVDTAASPAAIVDTAASPAAKERECHCCHHNSYSMVEMPDGFLMCRHCYDDQMARRYGWGP